MFSVLRIAIVIGVIFYLSPVRQGGEKPVRMGDIAKWSQEAAPALAVPLEQATQLQSLWQALPEPAKKAVVDRAIASGPSPAASPAPPQGTDTLQLDDLQPAWRGDGKKRP